jgi:lysozyme family protein
MQKFPTKEEYERALKDCHDRPTRLAWLYKQKKIDNARSIEEMNRILNIPWSYYYNKVVDYLKKN